MHDSRIQFGVQRRVPNQVALVLLLAVGLAISIFTIKAGEKIVSGFSKGVVVRNLKSYDLRDENAIPIESNINPEYNPKVNPSGE